MGTIIAIDLGLKRIGLALSAGAGIVTPLPAVERRNRNQAANDVKKVLNEYEATTVVVGIPMGSTTEDEMRRRVAHFMNLVEFVGEIAYQDESHSSQEAEALMKGEIRYKRDGRIDSLSAKIILERYLKI
ncbi:MAG: Holliday junction DNA helicase RuvA [Sulfuricurvum sp. GWF2_44_89]|uniref:Putative pre-16S rRNA nuclease n=1 Tax=Sulfuricurvum kujiense TaxID=148813 RepID=A0A2D3WM11_9BACT|nr:MULTISPECIES: Holliday junction resolvase RuvX [Sulfuricurvum]OHD77812.1 MAG: Holliday junction DNA helicase RuvA [Sulfuricurvum sp. GWF2_44_89]OHD91427.1 MAG: Holliday junction DNA helicase RuvA [Sulfuricurvum sp. RIFOXYD2_FULL_44_160]OHD96098.1 MAG: Holliday junction DNA helicase RuvA [Sulfuricurvum sp. RIFOXYD12_FULL_44_77]DAB38149.1 MAG TPA: Holliday junction resolvase RuvX [Sulfuricurvum kujiense]